jgi:hypothetical protein
MFGRGLHTTDGGLGAAMVVTRIGDKAHPVCEEHARRLERIWRDVVLWLGVGG